MQNGISRRAWKPSERLEVSLVGKNLLKVRHPEFVQVGFIPREGERGVYAKFTWHF